MTEKLCICCKQRKQLENKVTMLTRENTYLKQKLRMHESWNRPSSEAVIFSKKRKKFKMLVNAQIKDKDKTIDQITTKRNPGHQLGVKGKSHNQKPQFVKVYDSANAMCRICSRTDVQPCRIQYKTVIDIDKCRVQICYLEKTTPVRCIQCNVIKHPLTGSIRGSWFGPNLRKLIINMHCEIPPVRSIKALLDSNHDVDAGTGTISNCLAAVKQYIDHRRCVLLKEEPIELKTPPSSARRCLSR